MWCPQSVAHKQPGNAQNETEHPDRAREREKKTRERERERDRERERGRERGREGGNQTQHMMAPYRDPTGISIY